MARLPTKAIRDASIKSMRSRFLVPYEPQVAEHLKLSSPFEDIALAFRQNITSVLSVVTLPFNLASSAIHRQHYQRVSTAEAIRAGVVAKPRSEMSQAERNVADAARQKTAERMQQLVQSPEGQLQIGGDISAFLLTSMEEDALARSTLELLLQGVASMWTAFEVLSRDLFVAHLNRNPHLVARLVEYPSTRKRFEAAKVPLVDLIESGFNLSNGMGEYLSKQQDLSDLT